MQQQDKDNTLHVPQNPSCSFLPARNSIRELKRTAAAEQSEFNVWSPEQQNQTLSEISACSTHQGRDVLCLLRLY